MIMLCPYRRKLKSCRTSQKATVYGHQPGGFLQTGFKSRPSGARICLDNPDSPFSVDTEIYAELS